MDTTAVAGLGVYLAAYGLFLFAVPVLLLFLAMASRGRDRFSTGVLFAATALFALQWLALGPLELWPSMPGVLSLVVGLAGAGALAVRLGRDKRSRYVRSTGESLAVLMVGAVLLVMLLSLPVFATRP